MGSFGHSKGLRLGLTASWCSTRPVMGHETVGMEKKRYFLKLIERLIQEEYYRRIGLLLSHIQIGYNSDCIKIKVFVHPGPLIADMETIDNKEFVNRIKEEYAQLVSYIKGGLGSKLNKCMENLPEYIMALRSKKKLFRTMRAVFYKKRYTTLKSKMQLTSSDKKKSDFIKKDFHVQKWCYRLTKLYKFKFNKKVLEVKPSIFRGKKVNILRINGVRGFLELNAVIKRIGEVYFNRKVVVETIGVGNSEVTAEMMSRYLRTKLEQKYQVRELLKHIKWGMSKAEGVTGYRIEFRGRFKKSQRAGFVVKSEGQMPLGSISEDIEYSYDRAVMKYGCCGIKVWFYRKQPRQWEYSFYAHL